MKERTRLGRNLESVMRASAYTQDRLAQEIGVSQVTVNRLLNGSAGDQELGLVEKIANVLGVSIHALVAGTELATTVPAATLKSLKLENLLSFGHPGQLVELGQLNVLIGPNGSGKSNFIEAIGLLKAAPGDLLEPIRMGGGVAEWIWKGEHDATAMIDAVVDYPGSVPGPMSLRHSLSFRQVGQQLRVADERIEDAGPDASTMRSYFSHLPGQLALLGVKDAPQASVSTLADGVAARWEDIDPNVRQSQETLIEFGDDEKLMLRQVQALWQQYLAEATVARLSVAEARLEPLTKAEWRERAQRAQSKPATATRELTPKPGQSILSQRNDPDLYPELNHLAVTYSSFRLYRDWRFGRASALRRPQPADMPNEYLVEDASNLGLVLNRFRQNVPAKRAILEWLHHVFDKAEDFDVSIAGGTVQVFLQEGDFTTPASRLSDGTMRWLALLAVLLDPTPPPLVCLEEPELGLHPDLVGTLAKLLIAASERMQLIVTTHSDTLVDALSARPEAVIVCERHDGATIMRRLDKGELGEWLKKYTLGQLWSRGHLGGNRW